MLQALQELIEVAEEMAKRKESEINTLYTQLIDVKMDVSLKDKAHELGICGLKIYADYRFETGKIQAYSEAKAHFHQTLNVLSEGGGY
ncbi:MAG: hypothetical protein FWC13_07535 [Oscillospiraceae bacterium]|nr:hypothetical protein [Oscillospiraceae bacterium]